MSEKKYKLKANLPDDVKAKCHTIIHGASAASGGVGAGLAQIPLADNAVITPIQIGMIVALGKVFDQDITKSAAQAILSSLAASAAGRGAAQILIGWMPGVGNVINSATAAALTEAIGWMAVDKFAKESASDIEKKNIEGTEAGKTDDLLRREEHSDVVEINKRQDLINRASEFISGEKSLIENREDYNDLLEEIDAYVDAHELKRDDPLFNLYDELMKLR